MHTSDPNARAEQALCTPFHYCLDFRVADGPLNEPIVNLVDKYA
jgi:hypothetical protein